jgi:glycine/D-amino acid oxidase-like deaminating enzyme
VLVLEAGAALGLGASGRGLGAAFLGLAEHPWRLAASLGAEGAGVLLDVSARSLALLAELSGPPTGGVWVASGAREAEELERDLAVLGRAGVEARWATDLEIAAIGGRQDGPGLWIAAETAFDPEGALRALAGRLARAGGGLRLGARVDAVDDVRGGASLLRLAGGSVAAEVVVHATGARWVDPFFADTVVPVREHEPPRGPVARTGGGWTRWRRGSDGVRVEGNRWATPSLDVGETSQVPDERVVASLTAAARRLGFSGEATATTTLVAGSCDGMPLVGPLPGRPRQIALTGLQGSDPGLALGLASAVAEALLTGRDPLPAPFRSARMAA